MGSMLVRRAQSHRPKQAHSPESRAGQDGTGWGRARFKGRHIWLLLFGQVASSWFPFTKPLLLTWLMTHLFRLS